MSLTPTIKVFLGGTCNGTAWREAFIPHLNILVDYFNPQLPIGAWTAEMAAKELEERVTSDYNLYVITPKMTGFYTIAEMVEDSHKIPEKLLYCFLAEDTGLTFNRDQLKSLVAVGNLLERNGGRAFTGLEQVAEWLNNKACRVAHDRAMKNLKDLAASSG
jgi:hypothetical protein